MEDEIFEFEQAYDSEFHDNESKSLINEEHQKLLNTKIPSDFTKTVDIIDSSNSNSIINNIDDDGIVPLDDEDEYDKFVPTDPEKIKAFNEANNKNNNEMKNSIDDLLFTPPENFSLVCGTIYRSSFPRIENFQFLLKLKLKSIICLIPEDYPIENETFLGSNNIKFFQIGLSGNKEPFVKIKPDLVNEALKIITNPENHPILIHCNRGKHRTGCLVGCIRKLQKWSLSMIFDEYRKFSYPKERPLDQQFIEMFDDDEIRKYANDNSWLPLKW